MALWIGRSHRAFLQTARAGPGKLCAPLVAPPAHLLGVLRVILEDFPYVIGPGGSLRLPRPRRSLLIPADHFPALPRHRARSCDRCARLVWASIFTCGVVKYWWFLAREKNRLYLGNIFFFALLTSANLFYALPGQFGEWASRCARLVGPKVDPEGRVGVNVSLPVEHHSTFSLIHVIQYNAAQLEHG